MRKESVYFKVTRKKSEQDENALECNLSVVDDNDIIYTDTTNLVDNFRLLIDLETKECEIKLPLCISIQKLFYNKIWNVYDYISFIKEMNEELYNELFTPKKVICEEKVFTTPYMYNYWLTMKKNIDSNDLTVHILNDTKQHEIDYFILDIENMKVISPVSDSVAILLRIEIENIYNYSRYLKIFWEISKYFNVIPIDTEYRVNNTTKIWINSVHNRAHILNHSFEIQEV